ncbi:hypothetical protein CsSME_00023260 [Camellia sinensis var. sinensis]
MLMGSIKDFHHTLEKVTGCVVALLVRIGRLRSLEYERDILATDEHEVGHRDDIVTDVVVGCGDGMVRVAHEVGDDMGVKAKDMHNTVCDAVSDVAGLIDLEKALKSMANMEV